MSEAAARWAKLTEEQKAPYLAKHEQDVQR